MALKKERAGDCGVVCPCFHSGGVFLISLFFPFPTAVSFFCSCIKKLNSFSPLSENQYKNLEYLFFVNFSEDVTCFNHCIRRYSSFCLFIAHKIYNDL